MSTPVGRPGTEIRRVHPESPEALYCVEQYYAELDRRFDGGFDPAASLPAPPAELIPPNGAFIVAESEGQAIGSGAVKIAAPGVGSIKRMWVAERARGLGLGRRILAALEAEARQLGVRTLRLETNGALKEAIRLYTTSGYREVDPFNDDPYAQHWFEKTLEEPVSRGGTRR